MGTLLKRAPWLLAAAALCGPARAAEPSDRHQWHFEMDAGYVGASTPYGSWPEGGIGKLRYAEDEDGLNAARIFASYHGRITPAWSTTVVADYVDDASSGLGVTEAFVDWRPIPKTGNQQQVRIGAFYPPLSLENGDTAWQSPFTYSYSAINTWLGEEVRPFGAEWSLRRRLGFAGSPHELRTFAAAFYGNDPAGTLVFWRGWSLHDRQTRLNDRLPMPPMPVWDSSGTIVGYTEQSVEPFDEIDHKPGYYAGVEWRYARRVLLQLARYDNRADPGAFADGQWAWQTAFTHVAAQVSLPGEFGLLAQWLRGDTYWIAGARPNGTLGWGASLVEDALEAKFLMLTRVVHGAHRFSLRYDTFGVDREDTASGFYSDEGRAWTFGYRYERSARLSGGVEWLRIESARELWEDFYAVDEDATERQIRVQVTLKLGIPALR